MRPILAALALVVLLCVPPLAAADHSYSHRYVIHGRVVDADGAPVRDVTLRLGFRGVQAEGLCSRQPGTETEAFGPTDTRAVTNAFGEFTFCAHAHTISRTAPGTAILEIPAANVTREVELDPLFRVSFALVELPDAVGNASVLEGAYTVAGRVWQQAEGAIAVEGVRVHGRTVDRTPVNVTIEAGDRTFTAATTTNNYGDFSLRVPVSGRLAEGRVVVEALGHEAEAAVAPEGVRFLKLETPWSGESPPAAPTPAEDAPPGGEQGDPDRGTPTTAATPGAGQGGLATVTPGAVTPATGTPATGTPGGASAESGGGSEVPLPAALVPLALLAALALSRRR